MNDRHFRQRLALAGILLMTALATRAVKAQDDSVIDATAHQPKSNAAPRPEPGEMTDEQRKSNVVSILVMLLGGVGILGVALIGMAMIWGAHVRRLVRHTGHPPTRQDELWYMRRPPPDIVEPVPPTSNAGDAPTTDREIEE